MASPEIAAAASGEGALQLDFGTRRGTTHVAKSFQSGCLRVRVPRYRDGAVPEAVILNTGGGLVGGDRLDQSVRWRTGARATVTSQAAEKVYRTSGERAVITVHLEVDVGADAEWLPQETILFDQARLARRTEVRLAADARFLGIEAVVLGRTAMGERVRSGLLDDRWRIWRDGRLIYADALRLSGKIEAHMQRAAMGGGAAAMAVIILVSDGAAAACAAVRAAMIAARGLAAVTAYGPLLIVRLLACEGMSLKHDIISALGALRGGRPLPRMWSF